MDHVKAWGQYFTPRHVAEFMVSLIQKEKSAMILEPSAGKGIFLDVLWRKGFKNLRAYEIDADLPNESSVAISYEDFLEIDESLSPEVIIGNPPYVRWKNLKKRERERFRNDPQWKGVMNGLSDLSHAFIHRCVEILEPGGELILITPCFWTETLHSSDIRRKIAQLGELATLVSFYEMRIFPTVSSSTIIFKFVKEHSDRSVKVVHVWSKTNLTQEILSRVGETLRALELCEEHISEGEVEGYVHPQFKGGIPWKFLPPVLTRKLKAIENACRQGAPLVRISTGQNIPLTHLYEEDDLEMLPFSKTTLKRVKFSGKGYWTSKETARTANLSYLLKEKRVKKNSLRQHRRFVRLGDIAEIGNGMVSGLDRAFKLPRDIELSSKEKNLVIPVLKAKSLHQFFYDRATAYAFPNGVSTETELQEGYPNIFKHLLGFKEALLKRYNYDRYIPWWEWVFLRNKSLLETNSQKIFVPCKDRFDKRNNVRFVHVEGRFYATQDVTVISKSNLFKEETRYLVAVLNSDITFEWLKHKGLTRGGVLEFSEKPLTRIPVRLINWNNDTEVMIHNSIVRLVNRILDKQLIEPYKTQIEEKLQSLYKLPMDRIP